MISGRVLSEAFASFQMSHPSSVIGAPQESMNVLTSAMQSPRLAHLNIPRQEKRDAAAVSSSLMGMIVNFVV